MKRYEKYILNTMEVSAVLLIFMFIMFFVIGIKLIMIFHFNN